MPPYRTIPSNEEPNVDKIDINNTLAAVAIAYIPHTTTDSIICYIYPLANWQAVSGRSEAVAKLQRGEVKAVVSGGILLLGKSLNKDRIRDNLCYYPVNRLPPNFMAVFYPKTIPNGKNLLILSSAAMITRNCENNGLI